MAIKWEARITCEYPGCANSYPVTVTMAPGGLTEKPQTPHGWSGDGRRCREHNRLPPTESPLRLVG